MSFSVGPLNVTQIVPPSGGGGGGGGEFIGGGLAVLNGYAGANRTFNANGSVNLPACLFVCAFCTNDSLDPASLSVGAQALSKLTADSTNQIQMWGAQYAGGSDLVTMTGAGSHNIILMASAWSTRTLTFSAVSPQSRTNASVAANNAVRATLSSPCIVPSGGPGFIIGASTNSALSANNKNWSGVEVSPAPSDFFAASAGRVSIACTTTPGSWNPEFWGSINSVPQAYDFACGLAACAFGP